eukprot:TRINITY_DN1724_c3_g2_i1.p1 TRINITY_DN1724_c3_g2~~TRINITY_DN1724_c3_g2_i1.p1  ORF type:complete len:180 (+),score=58.91 TRINITY_DN1724_c3_g2_i1:53-541(+)
MADTNEPKVVAEKDDDLVEEVEVAVEDGSGAKLQQVATKTGEEEEEVVFKIKAKAFRFDEGENEWKERGFGDIKFLKQKEGNKDVRIVMRRDQIHKVCVCMNIKEIGPIAAHSGSDKAFVITGMDYSEDEEATPETICLKFAGSDSAKEFKDNFVAHGGRSK